MEKINIWIDCDPGIDDAVALAMAAAGTGCIFSAYPRWRVIRPATG